MTGLKHLQISSFLPSSAQSKKERKEAGQLKVDITYLASDKLEGRRTGTPGEALAGNYIVARYKAEGIPAYKNKYRLPFPFVYGKEIGTG